MRTVSWVGRSVFVCALLLAPALASAQPVPCQATDGKGLAACVNDAYPDRLKPTTTLKERTDNATFLRNRLIETARCAKFDVGLNLKRGGPAISVDFIAWNHPKGHVQGVDIIGGWDDIKRTIKVGWNDSYGPPNFGFPSFKAYGPVSCLGQPQPDPVPPAPPAPDNALALRVAVLERLVDVLNGSIAALMTRIDELTVKSAEAEAFDNKLQTGQEMLQQRMHVIESRPIPTGCSVQFGLRCRLE